jgi:membrane-associated protein
MDSLFSLDLATLIQAVGYLGIFLIVFADSGLLLGLVLPGDSLLFTAGLLASQGHLDLWTLIIVASLGAILGDSVGYAFGKRVGPKLFTREDAWLFTTHQLEHARHFYERHGGKTIFLARFIHFVRTLAPMIAGAAGMPYGTFLFYNIFGGLFWVISVSTLGYWLGTTIPDIDQYLLPILEVIGILAFAPTLVHLIQGGLKQWHKRG